MNFVATTSFATEGITALELRDLGMNDVHCKNNRVYFSGTVDDAARACVWLRSADRVGLIASVFHATTFDQLFDGIKSIRWCDYISKNAAIIVDARCVKSQLMSQRDVQRISKKAIIDSLSKSYKTNYFPENGYKIYVSVSILKDEASIIIDLCGDGLHKRGYRSLNSEAPIRETLAASLLLLCNNKMEYFLDPFCGSGTFAIEAAMIAANIAPGRDRSFAAEHYLFTSRCFKEQKNYAFDLQKKSDCEIHCSDIDENMVEITKYHASRAGVSIDVKCKNAIDYDDIYVYGGTMVTNPPYGERILDREGARELMSDFSGIVNTLTEQYWEIGIITSEHDLERIFCLKSASKRKLFNSNIQCTYYQFKNNT